MTGELKRVLLVEDNEAIRMVARMALELDGLETIECGSGEDALRAAPGSGAQLMVLDVMMPGMNGLQTLEALRAIPACASTPVVFLTARVMPQDVAEYKAKGAFEVIVKPFDAATLGRRLREIFARWPGGGDRR